MKMIQLIPYMHPSAGGPPVVADRFCRRLVDLGWEAEIICTDSYGRNVDRSWVKEYDAPYELTVLPSRGPEGFAYSGKLKSVLQTKLRSADIVHIHNVWSHANLVGSKMCHKMDVPFVVSSHGMLDPNSMKRKAWKKWLYGKWVLLPRLRLAAGMIYTHPDEQQLAEAGITGLPKGYVVPLAADPPPKSRAELAGIFDELYPQFQGKPKLIFVGRLHSKKGLDLLIPAMAKIRDKIPEVQLLLVGPSDPEYLEVLKKMASESGVAGETHFLGSLKGDEKWAALAAGDLFMLPSYQENFAIAMVEALRAGTPAVISRRINIWNDVAEAGAGFVSELSIDSVSETVIDALSDRQRLESMSAKAQEFASNAFSWSATGQLLERVYREITNTSMTATP